MAVIHRQVFCVYIIFLTILSSAFGNVMITTDGEQPIIIKTNKNLVLSCSLPDVKGLPLKWYKDGVQLENSDRIEILPENNTLVIKHPSLKDAGYYVCASKKDDENINATIFVVYPAKIENFPTSINLVQDDKLNLLCKAQGFPPVEIHWLKNQEAINTSDPRIKFEPDDKDTKNARLIIESVDFQDRADYTCVASNQYTEANDTILVRVKDKYAALWPFLGICVEVAILCTIIFVYEKKRQKPDFDESDTDHNPDSKNAPDQDDKSQDVRQRK